MKHLGFTDIYLVPHAHLDLSWLGPPAACERRNNGIIAAALELLERDETYRYSIECVRPIERFLAARRGDTGRVARLFREGRLEIGALYVDVACDYCFDESLARNLAYGQRWLEDTLGAPSDIAREEDVLAHFAQMPQLLADAGVRYLKIGRAPAGVFRWFAPNGASVVTAAFEYNHSYHFRLGRNPALALKNYPGYLRWMRTQIAQRLPALLVMDGDDGTPPNPRLPDIVRAWNRRMAAPRLRLATVREYLDTLDHEALPSRRGDIPGFWVGVLLFELDAARRLHDAETLLLSAEKSAAACRLLGLPADDNLSQAWRLLLAAQDHNWGGKDPAHRGAQADSDKVSMLDAVCDRAATVRRDALDVLAAQIRHTRPGAPLIVYNPLPWPRTGPVDFELPKSNLLADCRLVDAAGRPVAFDRDAVGATLNFLAKDVPPLGYKTYYLENADSQNAIDPVGRDFQIAPGLVSGADRRPRPTETPQNAPRVVENDFYRIEPSRNGCGLARVFDKELGENVTGWPLGGKLGNVAAETAPFLSLLAVAARFTVPPQEFYENLENLKKGGGAEGIRFLGQAWGPWRRNAGRATLTIGHTAQRLVLRGRFLNCPTAHEIILHNELKRIDISTTLDWNGRPGVFAALLLPLPFRNTPLHVNTPFYVHRMGGEAEGMGKIPGLPVQPKIRGVQHWFCAGDTRRTVIISSPWRVWDFTLCPTALLLASDDRGGFFTGERYLQKGLRRWSFSLSSHPGDWKQALAWRRGVEPVYPLVPFFASRNSNGTEGSLPEEYGFCGITPEHVTITAFKPAGVEAGAVFLRCCEIAGRPAGAAISFPLSPARAERTDLLERASVPLRIQDRAVRLHLEPYEIANVKVFFRNLPF